MKKISLSLIACCSLALVHAQLPNSILTYANLGYSSSKDSFRNDNRVWVADIGIGYQFNEHMTVGLNLGFAQDSRKPNGINDRTTFDEYRVGPFLRYSAYIANSPTFFWFAQLNAGYQGGYITQGDRPTFGKHSGFDVNIMPALGVNFGRAWCLNFSVGSLGYSRDKFEGARESSHSFDFTLGQAFQVGVSKNFGGHRTRGHHQPGDDTRRIDTSDDEDDSSSRRKKSRSDDDE